MATLKQKPNGIYFLEVQVPVDGVLKRQRISCNTRDKREADAMRVDWLQGVHPQHPQQGGIVAPKGRAPRPDSSVSATSRSTAMTVELWLTRCLSTIWSPSRCKSHRTAASNVRQLVRMLPEGLRLDEVTTAVILQLVETMRAETYMEGTIRRKVNALSAALTEATATEGPDGKPLLMARPRFPKLEKVRNTQDRIISRVEETAIFECIDARIAKEPGRPWWQFKAFVTIALDLGFRAGEVLSLGPSSIREKRWLDPVTHQMSSGTFLGLARYVTKNDKPRDVPCTDRVIALFPALNAQAANGKWFPWSKRTTGTWYLWDNIRDDLAARGFDLSDVKQHTFRHTCATRLAEGGLDLVSLRDWLGHGDIRITAERYIHLMATHLHRGALILNGGQMASQVPPTRETPRPSVLLNSAVDGSNRGEAVTVAVH